ncbi:MAG: hypothetical protein AMXMBFR83_05820 [Phycisphaerae bacterium]
MSKALVIVGLTAILGMISLGCDTLAADGLPGDLGKVMTAARGLGGVGVGQMDQVRQRDRLSDGTGGGGGDQLRLRDGSCAP